MRRSLLLLTVLILVSCKTWCPSNTCPGENAAPVVCIDSSLRAFPDPVHLRRGQWVHFVLGGTDELDIEIDVLENKGHDGPQAWGRVKKDAPLGRHKYTVVNLTTRKRNDPEVMIDP